MSSARTNVAMISGIITIRFHAALNEFELSNPAWWLFVIPAIICLRIFIGAVSGENWDD